MMPQAPMLPPDQMQAATSSAQMGGVSPEHFLMAAADLHQQGALSAPVPQGVALQTGKTSRRKLKVIK